MEFSLQTARLILRPLRAADAAEVYAYTGDADTCRYMTHLPDESEADTRRFLAAAEAELGNERPRFYELALVPRGESGIAGEISLYLNEARTSGELGWILRPGCRGRGYMTEAAGALTDFAFGRLGLSRLTAHCDARNAASFALMRRLGMALVSDEGRRTYKTGETAGELMCALLKDDAPSVRNAPYPRVCAHRGFGTVAPENSLAAFAAAVALGAPEIEFDLQVTKDGEIVSLHDAKLDRVSNGTGFVWDYTFAELSKLDFSGGDSRFAGMRIIKYEDILRMFARKVIMNTHIKTRNSDTPADEGALRKIIALTREYGCARHTYYMCGSDSAQEQLRRLAPDISRCCGAGKKPWQIVERALAAGCDRVQLFKPNFDQEMVDRAHADGLRCNVFWSDDPDEARRFLGMGIDTVLTNDYNQIARAALPAGV